MLGLRVGLLVAAIVAFMLLAIPAQAAEDCTTYSTSTTDLQKGTVIVELASPDGAVHDYVYADACQVQGTCIFSVGYYAETNGIAGLQRDDPLVDDTCHGMIQPDLWWG